MPSQWIRWRPDTHIYEFSIDFGASWGPLPLNAAVINEGIIDPARLPEMSGGVDPTLPIVWTGQQSFSGVAPSLRFIETDQAAGLKNWTLQFDATTLRIRSYPDDWSALTAELLTLSRDGVLSVRATGAPTHDFSSNVNGAALVNIGNTNAGNVALAGLSFQNNLGAGRAHILITSSTYPSPDALLIQNSSGNGGIILNAQAGSLLFKTAGATRMTISNAGAITFQGTVSFTDLTLTGDLTVNDIIASGTIKEHGRALPLGEWTAIAHNAANFTASSGTWTVDIADQISLAYTVIGKTVILDFNIQASTTSASTSELRIALPSIGGINTASRVATASVYVHSGGVSIMGVAEILAGSAYVRIRRGSTTGGFFNFGATSNNNNVMGQISYELA